jgi:DNA mismatch repair protein MutL
VGRPAAAKKRNNEQYLFVNGRYFYSQAMQRTIVRAYEKLIPEGCMPSYFIYLTVDPERVDVNVHPQKTTVKFADTDVILEILQAAIRETLAKTGAVPQMDFNAEGQVDIPVFSGERQVYREPRSSTNVSYNPFMEEYIDPTAPMPDVPFTGFDVPFEGAAAKGGAQRGMSAVTEVAEEFAIHTSTMGSMASGSVMEFIDEEAECEESLFDIVSSSMQSVDVPTFGECMTVGGGYAVATYGCRSVVVSLRRAKERIMFEEVLRAMKGGAVATQRMFFAEELVLSLEEYALMEEHATEFAAMGFEIEYLGEGRISVMGRPAVLEASTPLDELIYELLHGIDNGDMPLERERERMAELMARRGSAGYGKGVKSAEALELLHRLEKCANPSFTHSGTPIMAELTVDELRAKLTKF